MATTYDDAREHRGTLPADLPRKAGATHIGMFFAWCALRGLTSDWHGRLDPDRIERLKRREITGRDYVLDYLDGKLEDEHLTPAGQAFAAAYLATGRYLEDYTRVLAADLESPYHVPDAWEAFDQLAPTLDAAHGVEAPASPAPVHVVPAAVAPAPDAQADAQADVAAEPQADAVPEPEPEVGRGIDDYGMHSEDRGSDAGHAAPEPSDGSRIADDGMHPDDDAWDAGRDAEEAVEPEPELEPEPEFEEPRPAPFGAHEDVLGTASIAPGPPTVQSEPAGDGPPPFEVDASDPSWSWEETVRRARDAEQAEHDGPGVPPALPPEVRDHARAPRSTTGTVRVRSKGSGWVWVGLVLFLLIYGCSKATKPSRHVDDSWDGHLPDPRGDVEEDEAFLRREVDRLRREAARTGR